MQVTRNPVKLRPIRGVSLIEVLVTVFILSVGLLGLAGMHFQGLKNNQSAYFRSQATILAYTVLDTMRANRANALEGDYDIAMGAASSSKGIAGTDLGYWKRALSSALPSGDGSIDCNQVTSVCVVTVQWDDTVGLGGSATEQFSFSTEL